jgi:hypothetical protein
MEGHNQQALTLFHYSSVAEWNSGGRIAHRRSLRQGDPLSLMLFILMVDVLGHLFSKAAEDGMLQPLARRYLPP